MALAFLVTQRMRDCAAATFLFLRVFRLEGEKKIKEGRVVKDVATAFEERRIENEIRMSALPRRPFGCAVGLPQNVGLVP